MSIGSRIKEARINKKLTQEELALKIGVTKGAIANYENGVSTPKVDLIYKLFDVLECDANYLYQDDMKALNNDFIVTLPEQNLIMKYRNLDEHGAKLINIIINEEYERCINELECTYSTKLIDKYPRLASAGHGEYLFDTIPADKIEVDQDCKADFAVGIYGDSMEPTYHDGETVLVKKEECLNIGDIGIFIADGDSFIKEYGGDRLISHNTKYEDILFKENMDIRVVGKVIGKL